MTFPFTSSSDDQFDPNNLLVRNAQAAQQAAPAQLLSNNGIVQSPTKTAMTVANGGGTNLGGGGNNQSMFGSAFSWLGNNAEGIGTLLQGIGALGSLWGTNQQIGIAKDQLNFQKDAYNTNLANQIASYNTNLEDKIRGRYSTADQSEAQVQDYLNKNRMSR